jgi:endonuclease/exonuclease/phosphatase family metal-dependent hydrolase
MPAMAGMRKFTKRLVIAANVFVAAIFLLSCANPFIHPGRWWMVSLLALIFPLLLLLVLAFLVFWLFFYSRHLSLISLLALVLGWSNIHAFLALNLPGKFDLVKSAGTLRIMTWNVRRWDEFITKKQGASGHRAKMLEFIGNLNADIVCLQEFFDSRDPKTFESNIPYFQRQLNYPYFFVSHDYARKDGTYETGEIIFSRYPILATQLIRFAGPGLKASESLIRADLLVNGRTIRIFTTHLQSVMFGDKEFRDVEIIRNVDDSVVEASKSIAKKLKRANGLRSSQADLVREQLDASPYPLILCGDFNDVPNSYSYFHIRGDRQDAFIARGFGIGRTYVHLSPTLRIDYILADKRFHVVQCSPFSLPYSDHHPVVADLDLP